METFELIVRIADVGTAVLLVAWLLWGLSDYWREKRQGN